MYEPRIHSHITDVLPEGHPLARCNVHCDRCGVLTHAFNNECMSTWVETGQGAFCLTCFARTRTDVLSNADGLADGDEDCCEKPDLFCINDMPQEIASLRAEMMREHEDHSQAVVDAAEILRQLRAAEAKLEVAERMAQALRHAEHWAKHAMLMRSTQNAELLGIVSGPLAEWEALNK